MHSENQPFNFNAPASAAGVVAQLGERSVRNAEVEGSNPFNSTFMGIDSAVMARGSIPAAIFPAKIAVSRWAHEMESWTLAKKLQPSGTPVFTSGLSHNQVTDDPRRACRRIVSRRSLA